MTRLPFKRHIGEHGVAYLTWPPLGVVHGFSLRSGGVSQGPYAALNLGDHVGDLPEAVAANRLRWSQVLGLTQPFVTVKQVHGAIVASAEEGLADPMLAADALISGSGTPVGVMMADCASILLSSPRRGVVAAVHAGWRGTLAQVVLHCIERMRRDNGVAVCELRAAIGPTIGPCCLTVGSEVAQQFEASSWGHASLVYKAGVHHLNLYEANLGQMLTAGMSRDAIGVADVCTRCQTADYFSYRASGGVTGRMMATVVGELAETP